MLYKLSHRTTYKYAHPVSFGNHVACLRPRVSARQQLLRTALDIRPTPSTLSERTDFFGNQLFFFTVQEPHRLLVVEALSEVLVTPDPLPALADPAPWEASLALAEGSSPDARSASQFQFPSPRIPLRADFAAYARDSFLSGRPLREALRDLTTRIYQDFRFDSAATTVRTPVEEVFQKRRGVCQDFAHLQIACLRSLGLAARYVSGYLRTFPPPGKPRLIGADASHAWLSVFCRDEGWLDTDPTNNLAPTDGHVTIAWGRDFSDVSPLRGLILGGGGHTLKVEVDMEPVEAPVIARD